MDAGDFRARPALDAGVTAVAATLNRLHVTSLLEDGQGRIWAGTERDGAYLLEPDSGRVMRLPDPAEGTLQHDGVAAMVETEAGEVWLGTSGDGIVAVDVHSLRARRIRHDVLLPGSLDNDDVWALYRSRSGQIWVGSNQSLLRHDPADRAVLSIFGADGRRHGLAHAEVDSVAEMPDGQIWLGTTANGIDFYDPQRGHMGALRPDPAHPVSALPRATIFFAQPMPDRSVFVGTQQGLYWVDSARRQVRRVRLAGRNPADAVWAALLDARGLWLGGADGLWLVRPGPAGRLQVLRHLAGQQLSDPRVSVITPAAAGELWVGTRDGLNRLDVAHWQVLPVLANAQLAARVRHGFVSSLLSEGNGRLWIAIGGRGIEVVDQPRQADGRWTHLAEEQGLPNANVGTLLADGQGRVWASTDDGLAVIERDSLRIRALGRAEGVHIATYWASSGIRSSQGELLFGGIGGLTIARPQRLQPWTYQPPVVVTEMRVDGVPVHSAAARGSAASDTLVLPAGARSCAVEFAALDFSAPERNRYAYRLRDFDPQWIETDPAHRLASYTNLPPGDYLLELRGSNRDGRWSPVLRQVRLQVLPSWYQTTLVRVLAMAASVAAIFLLVQARTALLRRHQRELELLVADRTATLEQRTRELEESERRLAQLAYSDVLTDLPNRRMFTDYFDWLDHQVRRGGTGFALLLTDLDYFKEVNDTHGHAAGDALLVEAARRLRGAVRVVDRVARLGGDEFAILLAEVEDMDTVQELCERILLAFKDPVPYQARAIHTGLSIGVALFPRDGETLDRLYLSADAALYEAKAAGRNTWRCFNPAHRHGSSTPPLV